MESPQFFKYLDLNGAWLTLRNGLVDQISTEGKLPVLPLGVSAPFRSQASQGVLIY